MILMSITAYKASQYLEGFLKQGAIVPETSPALDAIYAKYAPRSIPAPSSAAEKPPPPSEHTPHPESGSGSQSDPRHESEDQSRTADATHETPRLLLTKEAVPELEKLLDLPEGSTFAADVYRALEQARLRIEGVRK